MSWWLVPLMIVVIVAGVGAGLLASYFILKRQNKTLPLLQIFQKQKSATEGIPNGQPASNKPVVFTVEPRKEKVVERQAEKPAKSVELAENALEEYVSKLPDPQMGVVTPASIPVPVPDKSPQVVASPVAPSKSAAVLELENNLEIATRSSATKLPNFQTDVWNTRRSEFSLTNSQLLGELTEAYVDMLLANNIVWLVTELGRDSPDLRASYSDLKNKVADRLKRVLPAVKDSLK